MYMISNLSDDVCLQEIRREWWWQREERKAFVLQDLGSFLDKVCRLHELPKGNIPDKEMIRSQIELLDWAQLPSLSERQLGKITTLTQKVLPEMLERLENPDR